MIDPLLGRRVVLTGAATTAVAAAAMVMGLPTGPAEASVRPAPRFPGDPGAGRLYYGSHCDDNDPAPREALYGHRVGVSRLFYDYDEVDALVAASTRDLAAGRLPFVSIYAPGTWADVAAGRYDAWLDALLGGLAEVGGPVWLCLHHEPDNNMGPGNTHTSYRDMYRRAAARRPPNVALAPIIGLVWHDPSMGGHDRPARPWYALDVIDIVACDTYNHWAPGYPDSPPYRSAAVCAEYFDVLAEMGKPIALAEYGTRTDPERPGRAAHWMQEFHRILLDRRDVVSMAYFDYSLHGRPTPYLLDWEGNVERLTAFQQLLTAEGSVFRPAPA